MTVSEDTTSPIRSSGEMDELVAVYGHDWVKLHGGSHGDTAGRQCGGGW